MRGHRTLLVIVAAAALSLLVTAAPAAAQSAAPPYQVIASNGFNTPDNDYAWSSAWFNGKLYIGTARSEECVEMATEIFYYPILTPLLYSTNPEPGTTCPADEYDINLQAQIWQYTPQTNTWALVFNSPQNIPNPREAGTFVARDLGFRGMVVYDGALYVGDVTPDEYIPELASSEPPRILRTVNGTSFTSINAPSTIDTYLGVQKPIGFRAMTVYNGRMYVTASSGLTGDGVILEVNNPTGPDPTFTQISPSSDQVFELQPYDGYLYAGTGSSLNAGYGVYRTNGAAVSPTWTPVITDSAGIGAAITSVVSMGVYDNDLYVGASGWYNTLFPASEMIRIYPDDSFDLVAGTPREDNGVMKYPVSGLPDGFGNPFNAHFWRMDDFNGGLYVGTNDWSWALQDVPILSTLLQSQFGFDIWSTCDGQSWYPLTSNAFGDGIDNFGARTLIATPGGNFIGSANHAQGTTIWQSTAASPVCPGSFQGSIASAASQRSTGTATASKPARAATAARTASKAASTASAATTTPLARPSELLTDVQACGTVVSWQPEPGAARYEVLRSTAHTYADVPAPHRTLQAGGSVPDLPLGMSGTVGTMTIDSSPSVIATTTKPYYVDRDGPAGSQYEVVADPPSGPASAPSNVGIAPSLFEPATFATAWAALRPARGTEASVADAGDAALLGDAEARWRSGDRAGAVAAIARLDEALQTSALTSRAGVNGRHADLENLVYRLGRSLQYAGAACER